MTTVLDRRRDDDGGRGAPPRATARCASWASACRRRRPTWPGARTRPAWCSCTSRGRSAPSPAPPAVDRRRRAGRDRRRGGVGARDLQLLAPGRARSTSASSAPPSSTAGATSTPRSSAPTTPPRCGCRARAGRPRSRRRAGGWWSSCVSHRGGLRRAGRVPHLAGRSGERRSSPTSGVLSRDPDRGELVLTAAASGRHRRARPGPPQAGTCAWPTTWRVPPRRPPRSWPCCGTSRPRRARRREEPVTGTCTRPSCARRACGVRRRLRRTGGVRHRQPGGAAGRARRARRPPWSPWRPGRRRGRGRRRRPAWRPLVGRFRDVRQHVPEALRRRRPGAGRRGAAPTAW